MKKMNFDKLEWQRNQRKKNGNSYTKKYEKTKKGFLMRTYRNMKSRVTGIQYKKAHLYESLELLDKDVFYEWALGNTRFNQLFADWECSNYDRKLTPSIDRIDSTKGYLLHNMQWLTHSENSKRGCYSKHRAKS